jgi:hypothetical protein
MDVEGYNRKIGQFGLRKGVLGREDFFGGLTGGGTWGVNF